MSVVTEKLQLLITASAKGVKSEIDSVGNATDGASKKTGLYQTALSKLGMEGKSTGQVLGTAVAGGAIVGGAALAKFAIDGVQKFSDLTSQVRAFSRVAGTSAEDSSRLVFAMRELGIAPDVAATSVGRLETKLGTGKEHLEKFGIATHDANGEMLGAGDILANIAEAYQKTNDQSERAAIGNEAFGKSWQKMTPLLGKPREELEALYNEAGKDHQVFSADDLEKGRKLAIATTQLKDAWSGLQVELAEELVPTVTTLTTGLTGLLHIVDEVPGALSHISPAIDAIGQSTVGVSGFSNVLGAAGDAAQDSLNPMHALTGVVGDLGDIFGGSGDDADGFADKQKKLQDATAHLADVMANKNHTAKEARDAEKAYADASKELNTAQEATAKAIKKVDDAQKPHIQTTNDTGKAIVDWVKHVDDLNEKLDEEKKAIEGVQDALTASEGGEIARQQAVINAAKAQDEYNTAVAEHGADSAEARDASLNLQQARLDEASATANAQKAQEDFNAFLKDPSAINGQIAKIQEQINKYGDADGALQSQIDKLNEQKRVIEYLNTLPPPVIPVSFPNLSEAWLASELLKRNLVTLTQTDWQVIVDVAGLPPAGTY